ncbi:hypothetical protein ACOMHN_014361 [Nucella lapillus]
MDEKRVWAGGREWVVVHPLASGPQSLSQSVHVAERGNVCRLVAFPAESCCPCVQEWWTVGTSAAWRQDQCFVSTDVPWGRPRPVSTDVPWGRPWLSPLTSPGADPGLSPLTSPGADPGCLH